MPLKYIFNYTYYINLKSFVTILNIVKAFRIFIIYTHLIPKCQVKFLKYTSRPK